MAAEGKTERDILNYYLERTAKPPRTPRFFNEEGGKSPADLFPAEEHIAALALTDVNGDAKDLVVRYNLGTNGRLHSFIRKKTVAHPQFCKD
jgi:hypothetical protein